MAGNGQRTQRPIPIRTLADLGPRNRLDVHCQRCRRTLRLDVKALVAAYEPLSFDQLRRRLKCGRCGARQPALVQSYDNS
jgi:hypothetical protein